MSPPEAYRDIPGSRPGGPRFVPGLCRYSDADPEQISDPGPHSGHTGQLGVRMGRGSRELRRDPGAYTIQKAVYQVKSTYLSKHPI